MKMHLISMDNEGMCIDELKNTSANVVHITPSHHFPSWHYNEHQS